jgi:hypothetical protein
MTVSRNPCKGLELSDRRYKILTHINIHTCDGDITLFCNENKHYDSLHKRQPTSLAVSDLHGNRVAAVRAVPEQNIIRPAAEKQKTCEEK